MRGLCSLDGDLYYTYNEKKDKKDSDMYIRRCHNEESSDAVLLPDDCTRVAGIIGESIFYLTESDQSYKISILSGS